MIDAQQRKRSDNSALSAMADRNWAGNDAIMPRDSQ